MDPSASFTIENVDAAKISLPWARRDSPQRLGGQGVSQSWPSPEPIAWFFFAPSDFPPRPRAGIWKNRVAKNRVLV
jgi:hypothetical protein